MATNQTLHNSLRDILKDLDPHRKQAAAKSAEPMSEPGSQGGATENPIKGIDDSLIPEETGSRYSENTSDSKKMTGPAGVESTPDRKPGQSTQDKRQYAIGVTSKATGEDPKNEDNYKSDKDDPGTTAPMSTDDGKKYGSADLDKLANDFSSLANPLLAEIVAGGLPKSAASQTAQGSPAAAQAAADGFKAASGGPSDDDIAHAVLGEVIKEAVVSADAVITFVREYNKRASDPAAAADAENHDGPGDDASGASEGPMAPAGGPPGAGAAPDAGGGEGSIEELIPLLASLPPEQKAQLMAALSDPAAGGMGGDPAAAGGGLPPMGPPPGGPAAGGAPPPDATSMPVMSDAMADMGATPGGLEGEAAKMASFNPAAAGMLRKLASAVRDYRDSGRWHYKPATDRKTAQARLEAQRLIFELLGKN